jgi:hypothetical protein
MLGTLVVWAGIIGVIVATRSRYGAVRRGTRPAEDTIGDRRYGVAENRSAANSLPVSGAKIAAI